MKNKERKKENKERMKILLQKLSMLNVNSNQYNDAYHSKQTVSF